MAVEQHRFEVNAGLNEKTGKWHAYYYEPDGMRMTGPARDSAQQARLDGEQVIALARVHFRECGWQIGNTERVQ